MRHLCCRLLLVLLALAWNGPASATQKDPHLDVLFAALERAEDPGSAALLEAQIWALWMRIDDERASQLLDVGTTAMANHDYGTALESFNALIARAPDFAEAWNKRATVYWLLGDDVASMRDIQQTLALEPRHFGALSGMGLILTEKNRPAEAIKAYEAALALDPFLSGAKDAVAMLKRRLKGEPL